MNLNHLTPKALADAVNQKVIGQEKASTFLANYLFTYIMYHYSQNGNLPLTHKSNALLIGASGTGKTHLVQTMAKEAGFNFLEINAKGISQEGWEGSSFKKLLTDGIFYGLSPMQADSPWTVVFIDEFDKLCAPLASSNNDNYAEHIQNSILKYFENYTASVSLKGQPLNLDTSKLCFILSGNFQGIRDNRDKKQSVGFNSVKEEQKKLQAELEAFGVIPEMIGRLSHIIELKELTKEDYSSIIASQHFTMWRDTLNGKHDLAQYDIDYTSLRPLLSLAKLQ